MQELLLAMTVGCLLASVTSTVGVSGAVFLLPIQLDVFGVPSPSVTPTNLLFNVLAVPGALLGFARGGARISPLARQLLLGSVPGMVAGASFRVFVAPGPSVARIAAAVVLIPVAVLILRPASSLQPDPRLGALARYRVGVVVLSLVVGFLGGIYGIGGGSLLAPLLVASGVSVVVVAPAALVSTFVTSLVGAAAYLVLSLASSAPVAPDWDLGLALGLGGLLGGWVGARLHLRVGHDLLRRLLGLVALALGFLNAWQVLGV